MKPLKRGMVVDVNLDPTQGSETGKTRPCVIVTNDTYNARVPVIQVVPITAWSEKKGRIVTNVMLMPSAANGLTKKCRCEPSGWWDVLQVRVLRPSYWHFIKTP